MSQFSDEQLKESSLVGGHVGVLQRCKSPTAAMGSGSMESLPCLGPGPKPAGVLPATGPETLPAQSASSAGQSCCSQEVQGEAEGCNGMHDLGTVSSDAVA